jgi:hypothetical protein
MRRHANFALSPQSILSTSIPNEPRRGQGKIVFLERSGDRYGERGCLDHVLGRRKMPHPFQLSVILRYIRLVGDPRSLLTGE